VKTRRYSEAQVFRILQEVDSGVPVVTAAREHGISPATIHRWKSKYGGMTLSEMKRLKALEEENARLKRIVAQQALDNELLREINAKNVSPLARRSVVKCLAKGGEVFPASGVYPGGDVAVSDEVRCQEAAG